MGAIKNKPKKNLNLAKKIGIGFLAVFSLALIILMGWGLKELYDVLIKNSTNNAPEVKRIKKYPVLKDTLLKYGEEKKIILDDYNNNASKMQLDMVLLPNNVFRSADKVIGPQSNLGKSKTDFIISFYDLTDTKIGEKKFIFDNNMKSKEFENISILSSPIDKPIKDLKIGSISLFSTFYDVQINKISLV